VIDIAAAPCARSRAIAPLTASQKSNDPRDVDAPQPGGGGLASNPQWQALNTPGPFQPPAGVMQDIPTQVRLPGHVALGDVYADRHAAEPG
jgi:hypothetical protein